jgi:uncharacterized protein YndB with AHSA1/START domain
MSVSKVKIELEYIMHTSPAILFNRLSTPSGLSEWFADDVNLVGKLYTFVWDGSEEKAELVLKKENKIIRFRWVEEESDIAYFEYKIEVDELTGDTALVVVDFAEPDEKKDTIELWNQQVEVLMHGLGSH